MLQDVHNTTFILSKVHIKLILDKIITAQSVQNVFVLLQSYKLWN